MGYAIDTPAVAEYNIRMDIPAAKTVFEADWIHGFAFTPLDSCAIVKLEGELYKKLKESSNPAILSLIQNYALWLKSRGEWKEEIEESTVLFDAVAVYMAFANDLLVMEELPIKVTDEGFTAVDESARTVSVATGWKDMKSFNQLLVDILLS